MVTCPLRDAETGSLLHWAASDGEELVLDLLRHHIPGIDFNLVNEQGYTPLHLAVLNDRAGIIERLVASPGIDVNARDIHGHTPLSLAAMRCSASSVAELLKASDINVNERAPGGFGNDGCFWTPLQWAATQGADLRSSEVILSLVWDLRVDTKAQDAYQRTARALAMGCGFLDVVRLLEDADNIRRSAAQHRGAHRDD